MCRGRGTPTLGTVPIERSIDTNVAFPQVTLWSDGAHRCVLRQSGGQFELLLYRHGQVIRLETCADEHGARGLAQDWLIALENLRYQ